MRRSVLVTFLLLLPGLCLWAQNAETEGAAEAAEGTPPPVLPASVPQDAETYWTVGFARFQAVALNPENLYLTHSLPLLLRERLAGIHTHFFRADERYGYQVWILQQEQRRLGQSLQLLRQERDELFFTDMLASERSEKLAVYDEKIATTVAGINALKGMDPTLIEFPESKEIRFEDGGGSEKAEESATEAAAMLIDTTVLSPLRIARQQGVNLLIWGSLEEVQGYLYLEVRALDAHLGRELFYHSDAAEPEEVYQGLETVVAELSRTLWGRDWASLAVESTPVGARVSVDGIYAGRAPVRLDYLVPGSVELRVEAPGYRSETLRVELSPYSETRQRIVLEERPPDPFALVSEPEGASVYSGSSWLGVTPLAVQRPDSPSRVLLRLEGLTEQVMYLGPETEKKVVIVFPADPTDPAELQSRRRDAFYAAFGFFAVSVPFPLFFWAAANDSYAAFLLARDSFPSNIPEAERLAGQVTAYYEAYLVTMGVSAALLINMMIHLVRFIRSADRQG